MKRVICGPGSDGLNAILYEGPVHEVSNGDGDGKMSYAWAAPEPAPSTQDLAGSVDPLNFRLQPGETRFMRVEIAPGGSSGMHRTPYIVDHMVALSGELTMLLEDGSSTVISAGDMLVQLGGMHRWRNDGTERFVMAGVVVGVKSDIDVPSGIEFD